jgi:thiamine pyrophosphokinase
MAELVDALDSGSSRGNSVDVRLILAAISPTKTMTLHSSTYPLDDFNDVTNVALVANGAIHDYPFIASLIRQYERLVAVDGGLKHCHSMNLRPDLIIGDFDSTPDELLHFYQNVPLEKFSTDKDETDMELAIRAINSSSVQKIAIFGALEKRLDHALGNLHLLRRFPKKILIETENETILDLEDESLVLCTPGQVVSLIPFGSTAKGVTTRGLKWELSENTLDKQFMSISNICLHSEFRVKIREGDLICCLLRL